MRRSSLAVFLVSVWQLDPVVRYLWPIPVAMFVAYPYLKRFTWLCHFWLGACLALAPIGAWLAVSGTAPWEAWVIGAAVLAWVAGFDLFYSLFDVEHDRREGLAVVGRALRRARSVRRRPSAARRHGRPSGACGHRAGRRASGTGSAWRRRPRCSPTSTSIVRPGDLRRLDAAFFTVNGVISVVFFVFVALDVLVA